MALTRAEVDQLAVEALMAHGAPPLEVLDVYALLRPSWMARGACRGREDVTWFPESGQSTEPAKAICAECAVLRDCRAYALANREAAEAGVWGGLSPRERRLARKAKPAA